MTRTPTGATSGIGDQVSINSTATETQAERLAEGTDLLLYLPADSRWRAPNQGDGRR